MESRLRIITRLPTWPQSAGSEAAPYNTMVGAPTVAYGGALFVDAVADSDYTLAAVALDTLARIGTAAEVTKIAPQLENENKYVAVSAANAILSITGT